VELEILKGISAILEKPSREILTVLCDVAIRQREWEMQRELDKLRD
jgi:hypothetical protein